MQRSDQETRPLLSYPDSNGQHESASICSDGPKSHRRAVRAFRRAKRHWPMLRILAVALLWGAANYGAVPSYLDGLRSYTCAYVYSIHPDLLPTQPHPPLPRDRDRPCAVSGVESRVGIVVAVATMLSFVVSSISMLCYGPRLSKWGRKPMLLVSLASNIINYIPFALLPLGYPFGDLPSKLAISPAASMAILLLCSFLTGLTGFTGLFLCVMRVMIVDVAPPTRRTVALNWLISATLCGAFFGPLLAAWALQTSVKARTRLFLHRFFSTAITSLELPSAPTPPPIPGTPQSPSKHGNPAALIACCWVFFVAIVWVVLLVPETKPATVADVTTTASELGGGNRAAESTVSDNASLDPGISPSRLGAHKLLGPLSIYLPQVTREGRKDYRLTWLALAGAFANIGTNALSYVAVFAGYKFDFTPDAIGLLLGLIGATRAVWLIFAIPLLVLFFERTIRKPSQIALLSAQELERLAKAGLKDPDLQQADRPYNQELGDRGLAQPLDAESSHVSTHVSSDTIRAVVLWRTAVDVAIAKVSYFADIVGYVVVFVSASFSNAAAMIFGTLFLSFGAGAGPAVASAAIAIIQDQKRAGHPSLHPTLHPSPTDDWLAALSISDNIVNGLSPILISVVYSLTIETALPSTCFLIPTLGYVVSFGLLAMVRTRATD
ncbi:uncharacterized protein UTRI_03035 [Ustilago trichophora]|uniref:Uncharacterized protein n=1 Tax=Ustilago trichophora TaxID=86804 RepID=A0A5C3E6F8_9BASI|nr:uncharacterized protein UTRI_03035 [Ustilago trichophora]